MNAKEAVAFLEAAIQESEKYGQTDQPGLIIMHRGSAYTVSNIECDSDNIWVVLDDKA